MAGVTIDDYQMLVTEVVRVVRATPAGHLDRVCPDWTIRQLVGHMVHMLDSDAMVTFRDPDNIQLEFFWRAPARPDPNTG